MEQIFSFQSRKDRVQKFEGEVFDVGEASESELEDLAEEDSRWIEDNEDLKDFVYEIEYYL